VYMLLGAAGAPVFAGFHGGFGSVVGQSGGFIWGFIPMAFLCGLGAQISSGLPTAANITPDADRTMQDIGKAVSAAIPGLLGLAVCHVFGVMQWTAIKGGGIFGSFLTVSAPFLLKDTVSTVSAYFVSVAVKKRVRAFNN
ncbi:MAG: biotin transporter BioY, partial [Oscillospiraceae bacterium]|nr:biotin transporter BioY [Oscillospiraceae bacterium]